MNRKKHFLLLPVFTLIFLSNFTRLHAQLPLTISERDIDEYTNRLLSEFPEVIDIGKIEISAFLENSLSQPVNGDNYYAPPNPALTQDQADDIVLEWPLVPLATGYEIRGLGLRDGAVTEHSTTDNSITIDQLDQQLYLFTMISTGPYGTVEDMIIIVVDKDLGKSTETAGVPCECTESGSPIAPDTPPIFNSNDPIFYYSWNNDCRINRYVFTVTGRYAGQDFFLEYYFLYDDTTIPVATVYDFERCNPNVPTVLMFANNTSAQFGIEVILHMGGVTIKGLGSSIEKIQVDARICGCYSGIPHNPRDGDTASLIATAPLKATPNPFTNELNLSLELPYAQSVTIQLFDLKGSLVYEATKSLEEGTQQIRLALPELSKGLYHLQVNTSDQSHQEKVLKL